MTLFESSMSARHFNHALSRPIVVSLGRVLMISLIVYGIATETSIGRLFLAGILPGLLLTGLVFTLTSFTCTAPFIGTLLVMAAQGSWKAWGGGGTGARRSAGRRRGGIWWTSCRAPPPSSGRECSSGRRVSR